MNNINNCRKTLLACLAMLVIIITATAPGIAGQRGPEELRGKVVRVVGQRIHIELEQREWLPRAARTKVVLGAEMAGMFVPLKGDFVVVQVNADSVIAMAVGTGEHGAPAPGMLARILTPYPQHPQKRADYIANTDPAGPALSAFMTSARHGFPLGHTMVASVFYNAGDHDTALEWYQRAYRESNHRLEISRAAIGISDVLENRRDYEAAVALLKEAAQRTAPQAHEKTFARYPASDVEGGGVEGHVRLLNWIRMLYATRLKDPAEAQRWAQAAADLMNEIARSGPPASDDPFFNLYLRFLVDLAIFMKGNIGDEDAAIHWLQAAARLGSDLAQKLLTERELSW